MVIDWVKTRFCLDLKSSTGYNKICVDLVNQELVYYLNDKGK